LAAVPAPVTPRIHTRFLALPVGAGLAAVAAVLWLTFQAGGRATPLATDSPTSPLLAAASPSPGSSADGRVPGLATTLPGGGRPTARPQPTEPAPTSTPRPEATPKPTPSNDGTGGAPSDQRRLHLAQVISGGITPKSVVSSQTGLFFVQNMMYLHTIRVYDRSFNVVKTIRDAVDLAKFGYRQFPGRVRGAPVEAAFTPDHRTAYVSQYAMFGPGFNHPGDDTCLPSWQVDRGFVYRIDVATLRKTGAVEVGSTPKFLAVTPDGKRLLVSNWCSGDVSVINLATFQPITRVRVGWHPRGLAFDARSNTAYVAVWDLDAVAKIDLRTFKVSYIRNVGANPRHLVMDPSFRYLYVSLNGDGKIAKIDMANDRVVARVYTGKEPRSMAIAADGRSLYVVNYSSGTATKVRTRDMTVLQTVATNPHPIGITYDNATHEIWIACYSGTLRVYRDV
jgi:YVTN family beta-propeller protein